MAKAFLQLVAEHINGRYKDKVDKLCIVLPNKRAALFLKQHLARAFGKTIWLPAIMSAEEFINGLSGLQPLEEVDLVCHLYNSYKACYGKGAEPFESFAKWGQLILQDFNEIDRYLADPRQLYENLKEIREIENWSLGEEQLTAHQSDYLKFMNSLGAIYRHFTAFLLEKGWCYQGLACRRAAERFEESDYPAKYHKLLFCGFNALNAAEEKIFSHYVLNGNAEILWDADRYYLEDYNQEAGSFLRKNLERFGKKEASFIQDNFKEAKEIEIISVPKQIGQAQVVRQKLKALHQRGVAMDQVAVVLANEKLLWPLLQQLPAEIEHVNITMGYPLRYTSSYGMVDLLLQLQVSYARQTRKDKTIYHKDLTALLRQPLFLDYLRAVAPALKPSDIIRQIVTQNLSFINHTKLKQLFGDMLPALLLPAVSMAGLGAEINRALVKCIEHLSQGIKGQKERLELEYLHQLRKSFNRIQEIVSGHLEFNDINAYRQLFTQVIGNAAANFSGEPLQGLQIMGVLETRCLDFNHVILVNANEGILPSGKAVNSFIPNDLKRAFGLPLYIEKDAIYAYHFYRLLQRASDINITCDSETDTFGKGEKSRFVTQLILELQNYNREIKIHESVATYKDLPEEIIAKISLTKTDELLKPILDKAISAEKYGGLSPSGLAAFKDCGLQFYFRYGARLSEAEEVEESAEAGTFGSILHLSLEKLYKSFAGKSIEAAELKVKLNEVDGIVNECFVLFFGGMSPQGKSLLQEEVIRVYVKKLIHRDLRFIAQLNEKGRQLRLLHLEQEFTAPLGLQLNGSLRTIYIKGKVDRIDNCDARLNDTVGQGKTRIIDYKSSVKISDKFVFNGFEPLFEDRNYNKQLQLLIYAWLLFRNKVAPANDLLPCIIPFKVFKEEPKFLLASDNKPLVLSEQFFGDFEKALAAFAGSIFNNEIQFSQTEDRDVCQYCAFNLVCNRQS